jgi:16S rRNA (cytosine967-C5)-methyltransferase
VAAPTPSRSAALDSLRAVRRGALASRAFEEAAAGLEARDRAWARELVFGTFRLRGRIDHRLRALSSRALDRLDPDILDILRLGAYQLTEMGSVPAYAAVSQSVELAKRAGGRGAGGFVNGVLQSLRRAGEPSTFPHFESDPVAHLVTWGSHPQWLVERWLHRFGADATRRLCEANNTRPELYLRALGDEVEVRDRLKSAGVEVESVEHAPRSLRLIAGSIGAALDAASVVAQDPAAGLVVTFAAVEAGTFVVDMAAAPGGKALALAGADAPPSFVAASDLSASRLVRLQENVARLQRPAPAGLGDVRTGPVIADGRALPFRPVGAVLLDAPCTGTGTLRRHPDGRWRIGPADLAALVGLQRDLLDAAAATVEPGGLLVYSTCSLEREENEEQVESFLERRDDFELEPAARLGGGVLAEDGTLTVLPHEHGWDGAYAARLRRRR